MPRSTSASASPQARGRAGEGDEIGGTAATVMVEMAVGKALLALLSEPAASTVELRVSLSAQANQWDRLFTDGRWDVLCFVL